MRRVSIAIARRLSGNRQIIYSWLDREVRFEWRVTCVTAWHGCVTRVWQSIRRWLPPPGKIFSVGAENIWVDLVNYKLCGVSSEPFEEYQDSVSKMTHDKICGFLISVQKSYLQSSFQESFVWRFTKSLGEIPIQISLLLSHIEHWQIINCLWFCSNCL